MNQKGSSLPLAVIGIVLVIASLVLGFSIVGVTREQINQGDAFMTIFSDYIVRLVIAIILMVLGIIALVLGVKG